MTDGYRVALTFDAEHPDRPVWAAGAPERILDALAAAQVRASFFIQGRWALAHPSVAERIAKDGHLIGNHSMYHAPLSLLSDEGIRIDVREAEAAIVEATGVDPRPWFRCPFGDAHEEMRVIDALDELGYRDVHWHVEPFDWQAGTSAGDVVRVTRSEVRAHGDGAIVLLHTWPNSTADGLEEVLMALADDGASFATVEDLSP